MTRLFMYYQQFMLCWPVNKSLKYRPCCPYVKLRNISSFFPFAEEFIRNNRGINDSKDLPREFLEAIYDEIERNGIKVKDRASSKMPTLSHAGMCLGMSLCGRQKCAIQCVSL